MRSRPGRGRSSSTSRSPPAPTARRGSLRSLRSRSVRSCLHARGARARRRLPPSLDRPFRAADRVRPHQLHRRSAAAVGERDFLHHRVDVPAGQLHRDVADLAALRRVPAEQVERVRIAPSANRVLHIRVGSHLTELVVEDRADVLPRCVERVDPIPTLRIHGDGVIHRPLGRVHRAVIAAEPVLRVRPWFALFAVDEHDASREAEADDLVGRTEPRNPPFDERLVRARRQRPVENPRRPELGSRAPAVEVLGEDVVEADVLHRGSEGLVEMLAFGGVPRADEDVRDREMLERLAAEVLHVQVRLGRELGGARVGVDAGGRRRGRDGDAGQMRCGGGERGHAVSLRKPQPFATPPTLLHRGPYVYCAPPTAPAYWGCGTMRMYGFGDSHSPKVSLASSSETDPAMITLSPCCHWAGVATLCFAVSCSESMTRSTSSKLRPVVIGYCSCSFTFLSGPITKTVRTVWLSAGVRDAVSPEVAAGSIP